jgi:hypothetical protein
MKRAVLLIFLLSSYCAFVSGCVHDPGSNGSTPCATTNDFQLVMPVPYKAEQAVLSATTSLVLEHDSTVTAANGVSGAVANLGHGLMIVGDRVTIGGLSSKSSVALGAGSVVNGPVTTGGVMLNPVGWVVIGKVTTKALVASDEHVMTTVTFSSTAPSVSVAPGTTRALPAGTYGNVLVRAGATLSLSSGTYQMASLTVLGRGKLNLDETAGTIVVYVKHTFEFAGKQEQLGGDGRILIAVFGCKPSIVAAPFRGTISAQSASLTLAAPSGSVFAGRYFASSIQLGAHNSVVELPAAFPSSPLSSAGSVSPKPPKRLPLPPPPVEGCYVNSPNGWHAIPCATDAFIDSNFPRPDAQVTLASAATSSLVFGQLQVTVPEVTSEQDAFLASTASINPLCQSSGSPVPNEFSVQSNTNHWSIPSGAKKGDTGATQFTIQSNGSTSLICVWNVDVTNSASIGGYSKTCVPMPPPQRSGGLKAFDTGNIAAYTNSNGMLSMVAELTWVPAGQPTQYSVVAPDTFGLNGNWSQVSGGLIGEGSCSQAQLTNAEIITQAEASTCPGDTDATSSICAAPVLQPNASAFEGGNGTVETNNLTATGTPSVSYPNADLAVTNLTATTSGSCLGPSHAYVKDNVNDFGATPSTLGDQVFWESPDIFLVPHGTPVDLTAVSTETTITPGGQFDIWVRVHNDLGCADATNVKTLVYLADPSALSVQWTPVTGGQYVGPNGGASGVTAPAGGEALIGPLSFSAPTSGLGSGHKCLIAAIQADGQTAPTNHFDAPDSNQVAQRNLQFLGQCQYPLTNATTSNGSLQITLSVTPITAPGPSLTSLPDIEVSFEDSDSSWYNVWKVQTGNGTNFAVTHTSGGATVVRLGAFSVAMNPVSLAAGQSRVATGTTLLNSGAAATTLQIAAKLSDVGGTVLISNGGSCVTLPPPVIQ